MDIGDDVGMFGVRAINSFVLLDADSIPSNMLWERVRTELANGRAVRICGELVTPLLERFGIQHGDTRYLPITPSMPPPEWLIRTRDVMLAGAALLVLSPLLLVLALAVKLSSPGPIFHAATVVGISKQHFIWRKFRSMIVVAERQDHAARREQFRAYVENKRQGKVIDATRVTRLGKFLRRYSLDELPQLWNVVKGDMTLVGPRPCLPYEEEMFPAWSAARFQVRPGLTGVWQIAGRSRVTFTQGLAMDLYYRYARSFWLDLYIIVQTARVIVRGEGGE